MRRLTGLLGVVAVLVVLGVPLRSAYACPA
jgi:hypothetical protein